MYSDKCDLEEEMKMIQGWYYNRKHGQRLLSIEEIAAACGCSKSEVADWFNGKLIPNDHSRASFVEAGDVVTFLIRHNMPVSSSLLPPKTTRILFIAADDAEFEEQRDRVELIFRYFSAKGNILAENATSGKFADLTILTFCPDVVILFCKENEPSNVNTLSLLSSFPEVRTILFTVAGMLPGEDGHLFDKVDIVIGDLLSMEQMNNLLHRVFED